MVKGLQIFAAIIGSFGGFTLGLVIGWSSQTQKKYNALLGITDSTVSTWIGTIMTVGAAFSGILLPFLIDTIGRLPTMKIMTLSCCLFYILLGFGKNVAMFMVARIFLGFSAAGFCVCSPVYASEVVETSIRGALGVCFQLLVVIGILVSFVLGTYLELKLFNFLSAGIIAIHLIMLFFIPESPVFLLKKGKSDDKVEKVLKFLRGKDADVSAELEQTKTIVAEAEERSKEGHWAKMKQKPAPKALSIGVMLAVFQQFSGINAIVFFTKTIFEQTGNESSSDMFAMITSGVQVLATLLAAVVVEKLGRKVLLIISYGIMSVCLAGMSIYFFIVNTNEVEHLSVVVGIIPLICICLYYVGFSLGSGPLTWAMLGELFSVEVRGIASSICTCINWFCALIVATSFSVILGAIGGGITYLMFAIFCGVFVFCILLFTIETRGKEIEEIQAELGKE